MAEQTAIEQVVAMHPACSTCGEPFNPVDEHGNTATEEQCATMLEIYERMPAIRRMLTAQVRYRCQRCQDEWEDQKSPRVLKERADNVRSECISNRTIGRQMLCETFKNSRPDIEAHNTKEWQWGRSWTPEQPCAWIEGLKGTGKTYLAHAILNKCMDSGVSAGKIKCVAFTGSLGFEYQAMLKPFKTVGVLLLDDIDKTDMKPRGLCALFELIDARCDNNLPTITTANCSGKLVMGDIAQVRGQAFAEAMLDRLHGIGGMCAGAHVLTGTSIRRESEPDQTDMGGGWEH